MDLIDKIKEIVGEGNAFNDRVECLCYSRDMSVHQGIPDAVIFPRTTEQVSAIMKLAHREKAPVTARGTGTSVTGAVLPVRGGLLLDRLLKDLGRAAITLSRTHRPHDPLHKGVALEKVINDWRL